MIRKIIALIWLRTQIMLVDKNILVPVLMPYGMFLLFKFTMPTDEVNGLAMMSLCFSMAIGMAVGSPISTMIAEEKEKKNLNSLLLSGVRSSEYILSVVFYPICISLLNLILFPLVTNTDISKFIFGYAISMLLTSVISILLNFYVGLISTSLSQSQYTSMFINMFISLAPSLALANDKIARIVDYSFMGLYTSFYNNPSMDIFVNQFYSILAWITVITLGILLSLSKRGNIKLSINMLNRKGRKYA